MPNVNFCFQGKGFPHPNCLLASIDYYSGDDLYMFDEFQTGSCEVRRPKIDNLYDVFAAIRDDEAEHVKTMAALQTETELSTSHDDSCEVPEELLGY